MNVDYSKLYTQVTFAMAHDSHTCQTGHNYTDDSKLEMNVDQTRPISQQLQDGIRAVRISTGTYRSGDGGLNTVILQHGTPQQWGGKCVFGTLQDYLTHIRDFLQSNPNEIVTIIDEGDASGYAFEENVAAPPKGWGPAYQGVIPGTREIAAFSKLVADTYHTVFDNSGILIYTPGDDIRARLPYDQTLWPTLQDLITTKQRLIVFQANLSSESWMLPTYGVGGCIATSDTGNPIAGPDVRPGFPGVMIDPSRASGALYLINHYFYHTALDFGDLGKVNESARNLNKWVVGDLLIENTLRAWSQLQRRPNFLNVDFYQGVFGTHSYLMALVDAMNTVPGWGSQDGIRDVANILTGQGIGIDNTNGLQIGTIYTITCAARDSNGQAFNLTAQSDGGLVLSDANISDPAQQWVLAYNTPGAGLTLISKTGMQIVVGETGDARFLVVENQQQARSGTIETGFEIIWRDDDARWVIRRSYNSDWNFFAQGGDTISRGASVSIRSSFDRDQNEMWAFTAISPIPIGGTPSLINRTLGQWAGNFEVLAAKSDGSGYMHYWRDNSNPAMPWHLESINDLMLLGMENQTSLSVFGMAMLETSTALEAVLALNGSYGIAIANPIWQLQIQGALLGINNTYRLFTNTNGPSLINNGVPLNGPTNTPAFVLNTQTSTFELLIPLYSNGFAHYQRTYTPGSTDGGPWTQVSVVQSAQQIASIAVIQNTYNGRPGVYGNLEAVARVGDQLQLYTGRNNQWDSGSPIQIQGTPISGITGVHGFTQDGDGGPFVVVAPLSSGGIGHYVRGNDEQWTWSQVGTFLQQYGTFDTISLIHSQKYGNLECIARINDKLAHFWYDGRTWNGGFISAS